MLLLTVVGLFVVFLLIELGVYDISTELTRWGINEYIAYVNRRDSVYDERKIAQDQESAMYMEPDLGPRYNADGSRIL